METHVLGALHPHEISLDVQGMCLEKPPRLSHLQGTHDGHVEVGASL
jgi:hypothetical protein